MAGPLVAVITARMGSERLPGKVMMDLAGKPVTAHMVERLRHVDGIDAVWLGTSSEENNVPLVALARSLGIEAYAGDPEDVLERHVTIARKSGAESVVRVTADCPLFDMPLASRMIAHHRATGADFTYVPAVLSVGVLVEVISRRALELVHTRYQGELITVPIKEHPEEFHIEAFGVGGDAGGGMDASLYRPEFRLTLDEPADYEVLKAIYEALYREGKPVVLREALRFLEAHPEIVALNAGVQQKRGNLYAQELDARVLAARGKRTEGR
ncbi:MAG: NTP transferase domain-containing protein [Deltaproteobacteria bacterium]|nr:NTP transferase domain-containing protein [Deltaproteobacteria bacterium]